MDREVQGEGDGGVRQSTVTCLIWEDPSSIPAIGEEKESLMSIISPPVLTHYKTVTKINVLPYKDVYFVFPFVCLGFLCVAFLRAVVVLLLVLREDLK